METNTFAFFFSEQSEHESAAHEQPSVNYYKRLKELNVLAALSSDWM